MDIRKGFTLVLSTLIFSTSIAHVADGIRSDREYRPLDSLEKWYDPILKSKEELHTPREEFSEEKVMQLYREMDTEMRIEMNDEVLSYIHHFSTGQKRNFEIALSLGNHYRPLMEDQLRERQMPRELIYLPFVLSGNHNQAISPEGGVGIWKLNYYVALRYGLTINRYIDERKDPLLSTSVALKYLNDLYDTYKSWNMAMTAFAYSPAEVNKAILKAGGSTNYWKIRPFLPSKAQNLVSSFFASVYMAQFHVEHDMNPPTIILGGETETLEIEDPISFKLLSERLKISAQSLQMLNPMFKGEIIYPKSVAGISFLVPSGQNKRAVEIAGTLVADSKKYMDVPKATRKVPVYNQPVIPENREKVTYTVKSGDYLGKIAEMHHVGVSSLKRWNNLYSDRIDIGQRLVIYVEEGTKATASSPSVKAASPAIKPTEKPKLQVDPSLLMNYTVKDGDTLWQIAKENPGNSIEKIQKINGISDSIKPGQVIKIIKP